MNVIEFVNGIDFHFDRLWVKNSLLPSRLVFYISVGFLKFKLKYKLGNSIVDFDDYWVRKTSI